MTVVPSILTSRRRAAPAARPAIRRPAAHVPARPAIRRPAVPTARLAIRRSAAVARVALVALVVAACSGPTASPIAVGPTRPPVTPVPAPTAPPHPGVPEGCPRAQPDPLGADEVREVTLGTGLGSITIRIEGGLSPIATGNFVALAECGYYDSVVFHRVVQGFVIQAGDGIFGRSATLDLDRVGTGGPGYTIQDEPVIARYQRGTVAMARTPAPDSVGSQFFVVLDESAEGSLARANTYQIIGTVTLGMETVDAIAAAADAEIPSDPVVIETITVAIPAPTP